MSAARVFLRRRQRYRLEALVELFRDASFDFLGKKWWFILPSLLLIVAGLASIVARRGLMYSIDFNGGAEMQVHWNGSPHVKQIRAAVASVLKGASVVQARDANGGNTIIISTELPKGQEPADLRKILEHSLSVFGSQYSVRSFEVIGPQISNDMRHQALVATAAASAGMLIYLSYRFRPAYGVAAVIAMAHDAVITVGLLSLFHEQISLTVVAALLTLIGYSMNDTIVVFDRIRENRRLNAHEPLNQLINRSINQTLSRTVLTSGLTLLSALSLLVFGGPVLHGFSLSLVIGIVVGTFSSVFIASPIMLAWERRCSGSVQYSLQSRGGR